MRFIKHFFLALFTTILCICLSHFCDSSNYSTVALTHQAQRSNSTSSQVQQSQALYEAGFVEAVQLLKTIPPYYTRGGKLLYI